MNKKLLFLFLAPLFSLQAQNPLFSSSMTAVNYGSVDSPAAEGVSKIIDGDINTKFLDFNYWDGLGFSVNTNTMSVATGIDITTANDSAERDPTLYEIYGSVNGTDFILMTTGAIPCVTERFYTRSFTFANSNAYQHYRVVLSNQCNTIEAMIQVSEVQVTGNLLSVAAQTLSVADVQLYPNPSTDYFYIKSGSETIEHLTIIDALGKTVKISGSVTNTDRIDISALTAGIYFVKAQLKGTNVTKKLVVN